MRAGRRFRDLHHFGPLRRRALRRATLSNDLTALRWACSESKAPAGPGPSELRCFGSLLEDSTDHRCLADAAREREARFRHLANAVPQAVWVANAAGDLVYVNRRWAESFGDLAMEASRSGYGFLPGIHPEDRDEALRRVEAAWRRGESFSVDVRLRTIRGEFRRYELAATPARNDRGEPAYWYGVANDVHEREEAKRRLRVALEAARAGIKTRAADLAAMTRLEGLHALAVQASSLGPVLSEIVDCAISLTQADFGKIRLVDVHGELEIAAARGFEDSQLASWERLRERRGSSGAALDRKGRVVVEDVETSALFIGSRALEFLRTAGIRAVQSTPLLSSSGRPLGVLSTHSKKRGRPDERALWWLDVLAREAASILERREAEDVLRRNEGLLRLALSNSAVVLFTQDLDLRYTWIHDPRPGFDPSTVLGRSDADLLPAGDATRLEELKRSVLATGTPRREVVETRVGGRPRWHDLRCEPLRDDSERIMGVSCASVDVTELRTAVQQRDDVLGIVAHDLRNPLGTILIQLELMRRPRELPERRSTEPAERIRRAGTRMLRIIEDLLEVTQLDAGRLVLERTTTSARELLAEVGASQTLLCKSRSLELRQSVAEGLPAVRIDRDRILQVFENLVGNALKFTTAGWISVGARPSDGNVVFWVSDTGPGISDEEREHIFDRFWQAKAKRRAGAGLGLAIAKGIVEAHGGQLWVESALGKGSTFLFTLPADDEGTASEHAAAQERSVLVAEDDEDVRDALVELVRSHGYDVVAVTNGWEALERLRVAPRPRLMIIDLAMPIVDGWDVLAERERNAALRALPVIVVSGQRDVAARVAAAHASFLPKPLSGERLFHLMDDLTKTSDAAPRV